MDYRIIIAIVIHHFGFFLFFRLLLTEFVDDNELIPLHAGSKVFVSKTDLLKNFDKKSSVYTSKLAGILFGEDLLIACAEADELSQLDSEKLTSLIST